MKNLFKATAMTFAMLAGLAAVILLFILGAMHPQIGLPTLGAAFLVYVIGGTKRDLDRADAKKAQTAQAI